MIEITTSIHKRQQQIRANIVKGLKTPTFSGFKLENKYNYQGLQISIENKQGSTRKWKDGDKEGSTLMHYDYGYIRNTVGNDNDHVDCYINSKNIVDQVFVIHQNRPKTGQFDEDKVMLGFDSADEAKRAYLTHYDSEKFFGSMTEMTLDQFKSKALGKKNRKIQ